MSEDVGLRRLSQIDEQDEGLCHQPERGES